MAEEKKTKKTSAKKGGRKEIDKEALEQKLMDLLKMAKETNNSLAYDQISDAFRDIQPNPEQLEQILEFFEKNHIEIQKDAPVPD
jgi:RNA polymerase primary sigma factor